MKNQNDSHLFSLMPYDYYRWSGQLIEAFRMTTDVLKAVDDERFHTQLREEQIADLRSMCGELLSRKSAPRQKPIDSEEFKSRTEEMVERFTKNHVILPPDFTDHVIHLGLIRMCSTYELFLKYTLVQVLFNNPTAFDSLPADLKLKPHWLKTISAEFRELLKGEDIPGQEELAEILSKDMEYWQSLPDKILLKSIRIPESQIGKLFFYFAVTRTIFMSEREGVLGYISVFNKLFGLNTTSVLELETLGQMSKEKLKELRGEAVSQIFEERNQYVHWQRFTVKNIEHLQTYRDLLQCLTECFGRAVVDHFKMDFSIVGIGKFKP